MIMTKIIILRILQDNQKARKNQIYSSKNYYKIHLQTLRRVDLWDLIQVYLDLVRSTDP